MRESDKRAITAIIDKAEAGRVDRHGDRVSARSEFAGLFIAIKDIKKISASMDTESREKVLFEIEWAQNGWRDRIRVPRVEAARIWTVLNRIESIEVTRFDNLLGG